MLKRLLFTFGPPLAVCAAFALLFAPPEHLPPRDIPPDVKRIVSLSPSITRQIAELGASTLVVGVTSFDDPQPHRVAVVGSLLQPNLEAVIALRPDLVLFSREDSPVQNTERISATGIPSRVFPRNNSYEDIETNFTALARIVGREDRAAVLLAGHRRRLESMKADLPHRPRLAFFVSHSPSIVASERSFIGAVIRDAGGRALLDAPIPYPLVSLETIAALRPDIIVSLDRDARSFFRALGKDLGEIPAIKNDCIYSISPDHICYYTPADYLHSVAELSEIMKRACGGRR